MRKTSYLVALTFGVLTLILNILSARRPDWLITKSHSDVLRTTVTTSYGLYKRCDLTVTSIPDPSGGGKLTYRKYECRKFPVQVTDRCEKENRAFCAAWTSAGYLDQIAIGFASISLVAILFGVSTHSRRRRIWRAVAVLVFLQAVCQIASFGLVNDNYRVGRYPPFDRARPGSAYVTNILSWTTSILIVLGVIITGISADKGHRWAAGNRGYRQIEG